ncbi:MAG: hypothetical protein U9N30_10820 [Campylobacterota bacterium]|nr:hypothetical protein [Campylobacterota bacterium]
MGIEEDLIALLDKHDNESLKEALKNHNPHRTIAPEKNIVVYEQKSSLVDNIIYLLLIFVMVAVGFAFYLYLQMEQKNNEPDTNYASYETQKNPTFDDLDENEKSMYLHKSIVDKQLKDKELFSKKLQSLASEKLTFSNLPQDVQDSYISKTIVDEQFNLLKTQYEEDIQKIEKMVEEAKTQTHNNTDIQDAPNSIVPYDYIFDEKAIRTPGEKADALLRCYDMKTVKSEISQECRDKIKSFLHKHNDAKLFEVVGVIGQSDRDAFEQNQYKDFALLGLAQNRANETAWYMEKIVKNSIPIQALSYAVHSKKISKGIMIRVYK